MLVTKFRKHGMDFIKVWWASEPIRDSGIIEYHQSSFSTKDSVPFDSLVSDITGTPEEIKGAFTKGCRYKVNRAEREDVSVRMMDDAGITDEEIDKFLVFFRDFWETKDSELNDMSGLRDELRRYRDAGALSFSVAAVKGQDAVYHTHIRDDERARLLHSASLYRLMSDEESDSRNLIGMANRYLHYADMLHFKEMGLKTYDWGGAGRTEDVANITEFKLSFGGIGEQTYDHNVYKGLRARLFRFLVDALDDVLISRR